MKVFFKSQSLDIHMATPNLSTAQSSNNYYFDLTTSIFVPASEMSALSKQNSEMFIILRFTKKSIEFLIIVQQVTCVIFSYFQNHFFTSFSKMFSKFLKNAISSKRTDDGRFKNEYLLQFMISFSEIEKNFLSNHAFDIDQFGHGLFKTI